MSVPVHVVGGFLGAGKTTTLLSLIERLAPGERVAVVVNDFGESAVDQQIVGERGLAIQEIRGACVCCTAPEGFVGAVAALLDEVRPDRILVEPTGLARPADLVDTLRRAPYRDRVAIAPLIVVVDPHVLAADPEAARQAEVADFLVANRTDLATGEELAAFDRWVEALWPAPLSVIRTERGQVPLEVLEWPEGAGPRADAGQVDDHPVQEGAEPAGHTGAHGHEHDVHGHVARTWVWPPAVVFHRRRLMAALDALIRGAAGRLSRLKGLVRTEEGVELIEVAGDRVHGRPSAWRRDSRVDAIVAAEGADLERIGALLEDARLRPEEAAASGTTVEVALPDGRSRVLDRAALDALPEAVEDVSVLVPGRRGRAARLRALLAEVDAPADVDAVVVALDGYATPPVPVDALAEGVLVHSLEGEPLPAKQGGPFRLLIPGDAGPGGPCANVKGVIRIALRPR